MMFVVEYGITSKALMVVKHDHKCIFAVTVNKAVKLKGLGI